MDGAGWIQVTVLRRKLQTSSSVIGGFLPHSEITSETIHSVPSTRAPNL